MEETRQLVSEEIGEGPRKVVFLHGLMGRGKNFTTIAKRLGEEFTVLLVDLPNHGASAWTESFDYDQLADMVADFLRVGFAHEQTVDVVGHSMGGKIAMRLALRHPDLVRRLAVLDIAPSASAGNFKHLLGSMLALPLQEFTSRADAQKALASAVPADGTRGFLLQNLKRVQGEFVWEPNLRMLYKNLPAIMDWTQPDAQFNGPVLWVAGEKSDYIKPEDSAPMRQLFPRVRKLTLKGAGHWVHADKPDEIVYMLQTFLSDQ